ncbi:plasma protease C1 inhibitor-like [Heptranchias perlo]|uniref:plasma protease C1 inhibitor-like n=1 Tax=Heptranchias perlo TaxID=212740 RepID=UPI00355A05F5
MKDFYGPISLLLATCDIFLLAGAEPGSFLLAEPSRVERENVTGLVAVHRRPPRPCEVSPHHHCSRYPDPWLSCGSPRGEEETRALADSLAEFGLKAFSTVAKFNPGANVLLSPISLAAALTHLLLGARNESKRDLEDALFYRNLSCVHETFKHLLNGTESMLSASQLFYKEGLCLEKSFLQRSERFYGNQPLPLSGDSSANARTVNDWVAANTEGRITSLVKEVPEETILMLLNAVFFKGAWKTRFDKKETKMGNFWVTPRKKVRVQMMQNSIYPLAAMFHEGLNVKVGKFQMFGKNSLVVILPQDSERSLSEVERALTFDQLRDIMNTLKQGNYKATSVVLPKFKMNFTQDLLLPFSDMGLQDVLLQPNLCGMTFARRVEISAATHRAVLTVDEEGVEAAAVTSISVARHVLVFEVLRPFLLLLWNEALGYPLFMGRVLDPSQ